MIRYGTRDAGPAPADTTTTPDTVFRLLLSASIVILTAHAGGLLCRRLGLPRLIGEMIAGIALGPSVLGALLPRTQTALFGHETYDLINVLAQLGVLLFMFVIGLELPITLLRRSGTTSLVIGHGTLALPLLTGALLALWLPAGLRPPDAPETAYTLFIGLALSVTALPVLARILTESGRIGTRTGALGLAGAAICDITAWAILALVIALIHGDGYHGLVLTLALTAGFALFMWLAARPLLARLARAAQHDRRWSGTLVATCLGGLVASALVTELIGVHMIFGAFLAGLIAPRTAPVITRLAATISNLTSWFLLPLFFALIGLKTNIGDLAGATNAALCAGIVIAAIAAKCAATACSARLAGLNWRDTGDLSVMMSARGVTELVMLDIGHTLGLITERLFAMLVVMALVTTILASLTLKSPPRATPDPEVEPPRPRNAPEPAAVPTGLPNR